MKQLHSAQNRILGILGFLGAVVLIVTLFFIRLESGKLAFFLIGFCYFMFLSWQGLSSKWLALDGSDLVLKQGNEGFRRVSTSCVVSCKTWPIFRYMGALRIELESGERINTLVADEDLTWIMSRMPVDSITPYWRRKIGW